MQDIPPNPPHNAPCQITMTFAEWERVMIFLAEMPYKHSQPLIAQIQSQAFNAAAKLAEPQTKVFDDALPLRQDQKDG